MQALFDAVDISTLSTNVSTMQIAFIGVAGLFLAYALIRKTMRRGA